MKILHIVWELRYGGAETMLVDIVNRQCIQHQVEVIVINTDVAETLIAQFNKKILIKHIGRPAKSRNPWYLLKLNCLIASSDADIIHCHQDNVIRYIPIRHFKKNICLTVHGIRIEASDIPKYNYICAIANEVSGYIKQETGIDVPVVMNGVDMQRFRKLKNKQNEIFKVVQIGRLAHEYKGQHLSLAAIHLLVNKYNYTNLHLDIIGWGVSEEYLKNMVKQLKITEYVSFLGIRDREYIGEHLADYDLLVQPSIREGFGLTIVEAISAMTPVLLSNVGGMKSISQGGQYTYTFNSGDAEDFADKLYQIIHLPPEEREQLAEKAYHFAMENFNIDITVKKYIALYEQIIRKNNSI